MNTRTLGSSSRQTWRLLIFVWAALLVGVMGAKADPVKTLVQDTLYRADGSVGHGKIAIHWSGFSTSAGESVAAGEMTFTTNANGGIEIPLIPNTGSTPAGSYYKVVIKMDDGTTSEEQWVVPSATTTTVAAIRAKVMPQAVAAQFVSRDYVDSLLGAQASNPPVHLSGAESIQGTKTFLSSPEVPVPNDAGGAANKGYVDQVAGHGNVNFASPGPIGLTAPAPVNATEITAQKSITSLSPTADIRAYGAACDGVSDDRAAFQAAVNAVGAGGGSILVPGLGAGCYIANPTLLTWPIFTGSLAINLQGKITFGSTFTARDWVDFVGQGGAQGAQFHSAGPTAWIQGPSTMGTLGTNVSTGVQTFTPSTMTGIYPGTAITVVGQSACMITSVSRTSNVVTATMSGPCHVAPGYYATVTGVSDNSYNGTFLINNSDYVLNTLRWQQTGGNSTSGGGTLGGVNEDSIETALVTATTTSTATASFVNTHSAADQWGIVGVYVSGLGHHSLRDVTVSASGTGIWLYEAANVHLTGVSAGSSLGITNQALEINESWWIYIRDSVFQNFTGTSSWGIRFTNTHLASDGDVAGLTYISDSNISGGIKLDRGTNYPQGNIYLSNTIVEQPTRGAFAVDTSTGMQGVLNLALDKVLLQDNFHGYSPCFVSYLYPNATGSVDIRSANNSDCMVNSYYSGAISLNGISGVPNFWGNSGHGLVASNGRVTETELRGSGANLSPSLIPYATLPVTPTSSWTGNAGCTLTTGALSPDGTTDAVTLTATGAGSYITPYSYAGTPAVGDTVIFGGWVNSPAGVLAGGYSGLGTIGISSTNAPYIGFDQGAGASVQASTSSFEMPIYGDWWHPVVGVAKIVSANGSAHSITLNAGCQSQGPLSFWQPFMIYIPAVAGIPFSEIERWRQQLLHGVVPAGMPGNVLAMLPAHKLYWGNDTDLYRASANALQTDSSFNAAGGLKNNGVPVLAQDTNSTIYSLSRTLPTTVGTEVDLGSFPATATFDITYSMHGSGYDQGKRYFVPAYYSATGGSWQKVNPISASGAYFGNDTDLEVNINGNTVSFRLRRTGGTTAGVAQITIVQHGSSAVFTPSTATSSVTAPGAVYLSGYYAETAATAVALAANGSNCSAGQAAAGVDAQGNAEGCFTPSGSGGSMAWPNVAGIPYWTSGTAWSGSYNSATPIPANYLASIPSAQITGLPSFPTGMIVGTTDTQALTNKTVDGVSPATMSYLDATSSVQMQLNGKAAVNANTTGQAGTALALASAPTGCTLPNVSMGIAVNGNATCGQPSNVTGTAANLSGTPALPNGSTAITQAALSNDTKLATDAYTDAAVAVEKTRAMAAEAGLSYVLPAATTSTRGGVKPDGTTITIAGDVISAVGGGGGITALTGDVTASGAGAVAASVVKVNGGSVPVSSAAVGTNGSGQFVVAPAVNSAAGGVMISDGRLGLSSMANLQTYEVVAMANRVYVCQFIQPLTMSIGHAGIGVGSTVAASSAESVGIYSASGNKLIDSGPLPTVNASTAQTASFSPVTLTGGTLYFIAWANTSTTPTVLSSAGTGTGIQQTLINTLAGTAGGCGYAANVLSGGALPSTLGTVTNASAAYIPGVVWAY